MREILFRGKKYKTSVFDETDWAYGSLIDSGNHEQVAIYPLINGASTMSVKQLVYARMEPVNPDTVGQFTGLCDKNNQKIFEGDVVYVKYGAYNFDGSSVEHRAICGVIGYDTIGMLGVIVGWHKGTPTWSDFFNVLSLTDNIEDWSIEVIGNIHDNPELLSL